MLDDLKRKLNDEAEELLDELNVTLPAEIEKAVAQGDLRENSEYSAALERQQFVQARLDYISRRLSELSELDMDTIPDDRVGFGSRVRVRDLVDEAEEIFTLAFGDFIDFDNAEISMASPIGKALLGGREGEEVTVSTPSGQIHYEIIEVTTIHELVEDEETDGGS
ncbi:MAG TPA: GreA/GreB family elongation factor [Gemmatimonadota bacterium]|nr:GreA/GreB family elongation factor [Gemmatimonadota bacterium]